MQKEAVEILTWNKQISIQILLKVIIECLLNIISKVTIM